MGDSTPREARCAVIVGPYTAGKTTLLEAMLFAAGATPRKGSVPQGNTVGDANPEARQRQMTTDPNVVNFTYLGDPWTVIDCPGSVELMQDTRTALMAADIVVVVAEPDPGRAAALAPLLRALDELSIPHVISRRRRRASASCWRRCRPPRPARWCCARCRSARARRSPATSTW